MPRRELYFGGSNARLFLHPAGAADWVELDLVVCQWTSNQDLSPIYQPSSTFWDSIMPGNHLVQGGFSLNMTNAMQLRHALSDPVGSNPIGFSAFDLVLQFVLDFSNLEPSIPTYFLESVNVTAISHQVTPSGEPVGESYEFFARKVTSLGTNFDSVVLELKNIPI